MFLLIRKSQLNVKTEYRVQIRRRDNFFEHVDFELPKEMQKIFLIGA